MSETQLFEIDETTDSQVAQWYKRLMNQTIQIDEKLDVGSETATKRKFTTDLMNQYKSVWEQNAQAMQGGLSTLLEAGDMDKFVGVYLGLVRTLTNSFGKQYNDYIEKQVAALPAPTEEATKVSDDERKALSTERQELVKQIKTIVDMAKTFNEPDAASWALPPRKGATGPRGPRALYSYSWTVDGQDMPEDDDNPKGVANLLGFEKVSEFTAALKAAGINTTKPETEFTVTLKDKQVAASREEAEEVEETVEGVSETE